MRQILARFFVNIFAVLFLSLLLLGPTAFSATFVTFEKNQALTIKEEDFRFGEFLKIKKESKEVSQSQFNITFIAFPEKQAFYQKILTITNNSSTSQKVKILDIQNTQARVFFVQTDNALEGSTVTILDPSGTTSINLLVSPANGDKNEVETLSFNLEVD